MQNIYFWSETLTEQAKSWECEPVQRGFDAELLKHVINIEGWENKNKERKTEERDERVVGDRVRSTGLL